MSIGDENLGAGADLRDLQQQLAAQSQQVQRQLDGLRLELEKGVRQTVVDEVRARLNSLLKTSAVVVGLLGGLGVIGLLTKTIPDTVEARVKTTVEGLTSTIISSVKDRTDSLVEDAHDQTTRLGDAVKEDIESILKEAKESADAVVADVTKNAGEIRALREEARKGAWIVLQTDYGDQDHYMGALKGAILCEDPASRIETITADNPDYDLGTAANVLFEASQHYPPGTVFLILVNPGATPSDPIVLHTKNDLYFVGYDNGCLDVVARRFEVDAVRVISNAHKSCARAEAVGFAFTWLAPTASWLARAGDQSQAFGEVGSVKSKYEYQLPEPRKPTFADGVLRGELTQFDRFGNARTNIGTELVREGGLQFKDELKLKIGDQEIECSYAERYGDVDSGKPVVVVYNGLLQLAVNRDNFRNVYKVKRGAVVEVARVGP